MRDTAYCAAWKLGSYLALMLESANILEWPLLAYKNGRFSSSYRILILISGVSSTIDTYNRHLRYDVTNKAGRMSQRSDLASDVCALTMSRVPSG